MRDSERVAPVLPVVGTERRVPPTAPAPARLRLRPWGWMSMGLLFGLLGGLSVVVVVASVLDGQPGYIWEEPQRPLLIGAPISLALCWLCVVGARRHWIDVEVRGDEVRWRRPGEARQIPLRAVQRVEVDRDVALIGRYRYDAPVHISLHYRDGGEPFEALIGYHRLVGARQLAFARHVAAAAGVRLADPRGDPMRASRFTPNRWQGEGRGWRLVALVALPVAAVLVGLVVPHAMTSPWFALGAAGGLALAGWVGWTGRRGT